MDHNNDGRVDAADLLLFMRAWHQRAEELPPAPTPTPAATGSLTGQVYIGSGYDLAQDGQVVLRRNGQDIVTVDAVGGAFNIASLAPGPYIIRFEHPLYSAVDIVDITSGLRVFDLRAAVTDLLAEAKRALVSRNIPLAESYLLRAIAQNPLDPETNAYMSVVRLLNLLEKPDPGLLAIIEGLQMKIHLFEDDPFELPEEFAPTSPTLNEILQALIQTAIPAIDASLSNLAEVKKNPDFQIIPVGFERWISEPAEEEVISASTTQDIQPCETSVVEVDLADILFFEAFLYLLKAEAYTWFSYTLPVSFHDFQQQQSIQNLLELNPSLLTLKGMASAQLAQAKVFMNESLQSVEQAVNALQTERDLQADDLFVASATDVVEIKSQVDNLRTSLNSRAVTFEIDDPVFGNLTTVDIFLSRYYSSPWWRAHFPAFRNQYPILSRMPDPTFNGLFPNMTHDKLSFFLPCTYDLASEILLPTISDGGILPVYHDGTLWIFVTGIGFLRLTRDYSSIASAIYPSFLAGPGSPAGLTSDGDNMIILMRETQGYELAWYDPLADRIVRRLSLPPEVAPLQEEYRYYNVSGVTYVDGTFWICRSNLYSSGEESEVTLFHISSQGGVIFSRSYRGSLGDTWSASICAFGGYLWLASEDLMLKIMPSDGEVKRVYYHTDDVAAVFASSEGPGVIVQEWPEFDPDDPSTWQPFIYAVFLAQNQ